MLSETQSPTVATGVGGGDVDWSDANNIFANDGAEATVGFFAGGQQASDLVFSGFGFSIPTNAVIDGVELTIDGTVFSSTGDVKIKTAGDTGTAKTAGTLSGTYGSDSDLWDLTLTPADINDSDFGGSIFMFDTSGGDGTVAVDHVEITVYYHIAAAEVDPAEVPTRFQYKVYSNNGEYLGMLDNVTSKFGFSQDIDSVGSQITIDVGESHDRSRLPNDFIMTEDGDYLVTEDDDYLVTEGQPPIIATGASGDQNILMKNGNRIEVYQISYWHPNGKLMFKGQINRLEANNRSVRLVVLSDGIDMDNLIARGAPFTYTNDQSQTSGPSTVTVTQETKGSFWNRYGQVWTAGGAVTNLGAITVRLRGTATVTVYIYDAPNGNFLASVSKSVSAGSATNFQFALPTLLTLSSSQQYFFSIGVNAGQSIIVYTSTANPYSGGSMYHSNYSGGSGGGSFTPVTGSDLYFITASGTPTTSATYTSQDPTTGILSPIIADYNLRGGRIVEGTIQATGLSLTASFITNTIYDALRSVRDMAPNGFFFRVDLGTNELDFLQAATTADYVFAKNKDLQDLDIVMSIENVKNQLLFSGGETSPGVNLYKQYQDTASMDLYGIRLDRKSDNRVTVTATANAIGDSFIAEKKDEEHQTVITIPATSMDITLLLPGMMIGFRGFSSFIDSLILQIVRREYTADYVTLTLGMLPPRMNPKIERITRGLIAEQTVANPSAPS